MKSNRLLRQVALSLFVAAVAGCSRALPRDPGSDEATAQQLRTAFNATGTDEVVVDVPDPDGFATIRGVFRVNGSVPSLPALPVQGGDLAACTKNGPVPNEEIQIGEGNALQSVLIYVNSKTYEAWEHPTWAAERTIDLAGERGFDQRYCRFLTHVFAMRSTQTVQILNTDSVAHNTNLAPTSGALPQSQITPIGGITPYAPGGETSAPFSVTCNIHPWMKAWMITRDNPYFAVTNEKGEFEIANVPSGVELEFRVWQERTKFVENVTLNNEPVTWKKGKFTRTFAPDEVHELTVVIDAAEF